MITRAMGDAVAFCPPLIVNEQQVGLILERFARALDDTTRWVG
jgi:4-aminobutyrate--pyruvate transaminase